jgi:uncharacterized protein YaeQ
MALGSTLHRFHVALADSDRGLYQDFDWRIARHPSETERFLVTRVLAAALIYEAGLEFSRGISDVDEPALFVRSGDGLIRTWIEVGLPLPDRLHRAAKSAERVLVFPHKTPELLFAACAKERVHRAHEILVGLIEERLVKSLSKSIDRSEHWSLSHSDGHVYVTRGNESFDGTFALVPLKES